MISKIFRLLFCTLLITSCTTSCYEYRYKYYTLDGKNYITSCSYADSTYFLPGKQTSLKKENGYIVVKDRDFRSGWKCILIWSQDTAFLLEKYYDFEMRNRPKNLKLTNVKDSTFNAVIDNNVKKYILVRSE